MRIPKLNESISIFVFPRWGAGPAARASTRVYGEKRMKEKKKEMVGPTNPASHEYRACPIRKRDAETLFVLDSRLCLSLPPSEGKRKESFCQLVREARTQVAKAKEKIIINANHTGKGG